MTSGADSVRGGPSRITVGVAWAALGGTLVYGVLKLTMGLRLTREQEFDGADLSIHRISATPEREASW